MVFIPRVGKKKMVVKNNLFRKIVHGYKKKKSEEIRSTMSAIPQVYAPYPMQLPATQQKKAHEPQKTSHDAEESFGIRISDERFPNTKIREIDEKPDLTAVDLRYNLIPRDPKKPAFAKCNIKWNPRENRLVYYVLEPQVSTEKMALIEKIKMTIEEEINVDFEKLKELELREYLISEIGRVLQDMDIQLLPAERQAIEYYIMRDFIGVGKIEPLLHDADIEDISCAGVGIPVYVYHKNSQFGSLKTNIVFQNAEELDTFVVKLSQKSGRNISVAEPLVDGALPDGSRVQATLATDIARRGSNFTIRKFNDKPITPVNMLGYGTADAKIMAYLWLATEYGKSMIVSGTTASGKTSMLNALSLFIRPEKKIVTIEDTAELRLPHQHWVPEVARTALSEGEKKFGMVDMYDLLRESLRQRPEYIVVGEVRGKEAYVMFQQMATGHTGLSTIHADDVQSLIDRLTTPPISLHESLIQNLDIIVFLSSVKHKGRNVRRIMSIYEITGYDKNDGLKLNKVFQWNPVKDTFDSVNPSKVLKDISTRLGARDIDIKGEISNRIKVMKWMFDSKITDYRDVARIFNSYYINSEGLLSQIQ